MKAYHYNAEPAYRADPDIHLQYWGREECVPGHAVGPLVRDVYKIHFIHKGSGMVQVGEHTYTLGAGEAFLIYPDVLTYYVADQNTPWVYSWIAFHGEQVNSVLNRTRLTPEQPVFPMDLRFMPGMYDLLTEASTQRGGSDLQIQALMYGFLSVLVETVPYAAERISIPRKQDVYIVEGIEFIHAHFHEAISVQNIAAYLGLDRKYFSTIFREAAGVPPQQYLLQFRMDKACELLKKKQYSVGEVARSVGYQDALLFSRMFKKVKGVAPKHYY